jgi:hypothetical protein
MTAFGLVLVSYFLVTSGVAYDIINEPPAVGTQPDPLTGKVRPVAFMPYRINAQYIIEGLTGGLMYTLGALGLVLLDRAHERSASPNWRLGCLCVGAAMAAGAYAAALSFLRIKMPNYMSATG